VADVWKRKGRKAKPWVADYTDANGRRHRLAAATKEEAQELLAQKRREAREIGPTAGDRDITVAAYAAIWLGRIEPELKHASAKTYAYALRAHIIPAFGRLKVRDLTRPHVKWFIDEKRQAGLARNSINLLRGVLSAMLSEAGEEGLVGRNVALAVGRRRRTTIQGQIEAADSIRPLSETEVSALLDVAPDHETRTLFMVLARAGLRPGELLGLQWTDLDFTGRQILIERAFYEGHLGTPKSGRSRRVDMSQGLATALSSLYVQRERQKLERQWSEVPLWVFCNRQGEPLRLDYVRYTFNRSLKRAGLSGHALYDLRHTFVTTLLAKNAPLTYVSRQAGHNKPTTTLTYYAHWIPNADRSFVDSLDSPSLPSRGVAPLAPLLGTTPDKPEQPQENLAKNNLYVS
jgi:integrase